MSEKDVPQVINRLLAALAAGDVDACAAAFHDEAEIFLPRNALEGGSYQGRQGALEAFTDAFETWEAIRVGLAEVKEAGDKLVAFGRTINVPRGELPTVEYESAYIVKLREGRITYFKPYLSHAEALEAAGLSE